MALKTLRFVQGLPRTPLSADLSRASSVLDFVVPSSFQQAQQAQQALEPRGLEYSSLQMVFYGTGYFSEKQLKRKTTLKSEIPPDLSHEFLLDQQKI